MNNETEHAITRTKKTRIAPWGERKELREIASRVQLMAPGGKKLNENEALALAQGAVAHGLDPFNGEIWFIPGSGLMTGIKGLRKAAREQIEGNFWTEFHEITDPDERNLFMIPDQALAFKCIIRDSETIRTYSEGWKTLKEDGVPVDLIPDVLGKRPYSTGIGYIKKGESTKMDPVQVAMKRSEADALKRRFDLPFIVPTEHSSELPIDVEWTEVTTDDEEIESAAEEAEGALFGSKAETPDDAPQDPIQDLRVLAKTEPHKIGSTEFWIAAKHFGINSEEGQDIYKELGTYADALIYVVDKFGELDEMTEEQA